ncbi:MAG: hypothetical protein EAX87_01375 [Candidatus Thorarchaeota archaeon]|nr:hypothetical protein [Candidatus Thorarchaeota archaeon]
METSSKDRLRQMAGVLLIISAITHTLQVFVYGGVSGNVAAALYGVMYLVLGASVIKYPERNLLLLMCIIIPGIGGTGGVIRFLFMHTHEANYFIVLHVIIDMVVVPTCVYLYKDRDASQPNSMKVEEELVATVQ